MPSTKSFLQYVIELYRQCGVEVSFRPMMGEYLLYIDKINFADICDDRLLLKSKEETYGLQKVLPYDGAKTELLYFEDIDDIEKLKEITENILRRKK